MNVQSSNDGAVGNEEKNIYGIPCPGATITDGIKKGDCTSDNAPAYTPYNRTTVNT